MNFNYYNRLEADYLCKIDIWGLKEKGWLDKSDKKLHLMTWMRNNRITLDLKLLIDIEPHNESIRLIYTLADSYGNTEKIDSQILLKTTSCNYGGKRYWFECPYCKRNIGVLYYRGGIFACRHCQYLTYVSKKVNGSEKITGRIISNQEVEDLRLKVKRKFYNGKMTKACSRYLKKRDKHARAIRAAVNSYYI